MLHGLRQRVVAGVLLLLVVLMLVFVCFRGAPVPSVILLPPNTSLAPKGAAFDRWVPMSWAWYWRGKDFILGHSRTVLIDAAFVSASPRPEFSASFPQALKSVTNLHIYFVPTNELASMHKQLTAGTSYTASCRITTAHGIYTKLSSGSGQSTGPGFWMEVLARRGRDCTDLQTCLAATGFGDTESKAVTNLAMGARLQIPKDHTVLILKSAERPEEVVTFGVILTPKWK